jgi:hypothetical protein
LARGIDSRTRCGRVGALSSTVARARDLERASSGAAREVEPAARAWFTVWPGMPPVALPLPHRVSPPRAPPPGDPSSSKDLERVLAGLSADELVAAMGLKNAPGPVRRAARAAFTTVSVPLGRALARFDAGVETSGVSAAAAGMLDDLEARWTRVGERPPTRGPLLVVANHPGAYDALVLLAATGRDDVVIVAADRTFLRAMPRFRRHLVFVPEAPSGAAMRRAVGLRRALAHMARGGAVLHFGAGFIEPDPAFPAGRTAPLAPWQPGTGALVRGAIQCAGAIVPALVAGVHSPRAKRLFVTRLAERHGLTTLAPLLQVAVPRFRDVEAVVRFGAAIAIPLPLGASDDARVAARVRDEALALWPFPTDALWGSPSSAGQDAVKRIDRTGPRG